MPTKKRRKSSRKLNAARVRKQAKQTPTPLSYKSLGLPLNRAARRLYASLKRKEK